VDTKELTARRKGSENKISCHSSEKLDVISGTPSEHNSQEDLKFARDGLDARAREYLRWYDKFEFANKVY